MERDDQPPTGSGVSQRLVVMLLLAALVLVLAVQNSERLHLHLLFWTATVPAYLLVAMSAALGGAVAEALTGVWRHRRRAHDRDRRELDRLRSRGHRADPAAPESAERPT